MVIEFVGNVQSDGEKLRGEFESLRKRVRTKLNPQRQQRINAAVEVNYILESAEESNVKL